jgi:site-specific recombinase XerD
MQAVAPSHEIITQGTYTETTWLQYFDRRRALKGVADHCDTLPSATSDERYTHRAYRSGLEYFTQWAGPLMPDEDLMMDFIAHLKRDRGLKAVTIASKYLAPVRHYLKRLAKQHIPADGHERNFVHDCKERILAAAEIENPRSDETSNLAPLDQHGHRLSRAQIDEIFLGIERGTIKGARDLALLYVGFTTGLRVAEIARMTLTTISPHEDHYLVRVRGKRNNFDPVPLDYDGHNLIMRYVACYNAPLDEDDPRRINEDTPLWQPLTRSSRHATPGKYPVGYDPQVGITPEAIALILKRRAGNAIHITLSPHDMRRTVAALARAERVPLEAIQQLLRHKNLATTARYIGKPQSYTESIITRNGRFDGIRDDIGQQPLPQVPS